MPPTAGIVGLMLALAGSVGLAGPMDRRAPSAGASVATHGTLDDARSLDAASRQLSATLATTSAGVERIGFESPTLAGNAAESGGHQRRPDSGARPADEGKLTTLPPPGDDAPLRLSPPRQSGRKGRTGVPRAAGPTSWITVASSLAVVLGLFLVVAWAMRRTVPGGAVVLPSDVVEVLGRAALAGKAQVHLVRCGSKLLLVSLSPTGVETLTEITDPDEVNRLAGLCRQAQPGSATAAFRQVLQQFAAPGAAGPSAREGGDVGLANAGVPGGRYAGREGRDV